MRVKAKQPEYEVDIEDEEEDQEEDGDDYEDEAEDDAPKPRYAAYHGESDLDDDEEDDEDEDLDQSESEEEEDVDREKMLRQELGSLPLSALLKAQAALDADEPSRRRKGAKGEDDSEEEEDDDGDDEEGQRVRRERREINKRADKSAPMEMSSKRAVTRKRQVIEVPKTHVRDPRFDSLSTSAFDKTIFSRSYSFVDSAQASELSVLRKQYSDLRRAVAARAPSDERAAKGLYSSEAMALRTQKDRVGQQIKRLESVAAEKERRDREAEVKRNLRKVNDDRQKKGQEPVFFKRAQMKGVLLQDKFERLSSDRPGKKGKATGSNRTEASPSSASNMSVDRLRAMISSGSNTVPASRATLEDQAGDASGSSSAIKKLIVRKAKKDAKRDRKELPFLVRDRSQGGEGQSSRSADKPEGSESKKRHRGSRGHGGASKKART